MRPTISLIDQPDHVSVVPTLNRPVVGTGLTVIVALRLEGAPDTVVEMQVYASWGAIKRAAQFASTPSTSWKGAA